VTKRPNRLRVGGGAAFFNDRLDAAIALVERGEIDVLMLDTLAERTLTMLHVAHQAGGPAYFPALPERLRHLLPVCRRHGTVLVSNCGGVAPMETAAMVQTVAREAGLGSLRVAAVTGDDMSGSLPGIDPLLLETGEVLSALGKPILAANAYLGAAAIADAYAAGAEVIVTGRVTDSALALGPLMATFQWTAGQHDALACGVLAGHLLECGGQATGGYFAEPGMKDVPGLDDIGFPIAEVSPDLVITLTKTPGTGGLVDRHTVTEQILYEMHDPAAYITPDVVLDITGLELEETGTDTVRLWGMRGHPPPPTLKVLVGIDSGVLVEAEISYAGINAPARAKLARTVLEARFGRSPIASCPRRYDLIGVDSLWPHPASHAAMRDIRLRVAARVPDRAAAELVITEVEALYVNGPAGGGGVRSGQRQTIRTFTALVDRAHAPPRCVFVEG
jgi:hypothetical protein